MGKTVGLMVRTRGIGAVLVAGVLLSLQACGSNSSSPDIEDNLRLASEMAASVQALTPSPLPIPAASADKSSRPRSSPKPKPSTTKSDPETPAATTIPVDYASRWEQYPWGSDGLECSPPGDSPGVNSAPDDPSTVVVMGDSLIRNARAELTYALTAAGFSPVFVCWGGKTLTWGEEQIDHMRSLELLPQCLVINLGTNDLKGTTAAGLSDSVDLETVQSRLTSILSAVSDLKDVFTVDLAANLDMAPSTMSRVGEAPGAYRQAVSQTGVGAVVDWSSQANSGSGLIGEDGIHDSDSGRVVRAQLIADAVSRDCG